MERQVRYAKREAAMLDAAGDKEGFEKAALRVKERQAKLKAFVNEHEESLMLRSDRTQVLGYNRSVSAKASAISRKYSGYHYRKDGTIIATHDWKRKDHASVPKMNRPFAVVETKGAKGGIEQIDRSFYDARGVLVRQVHSGPHARLDKHPYGKHGEHAHDYEWKDGKMIKTTRDLTESERKESADILED